MRRDAPGRGVQGTRAKRGEEVSLSVKAKKAYDSSLRTKSATPEDSVETAEGNIS